jgi:cobalt-zinc-cadmium efflux system protein
VSDNHHHHHSTSRGLAGAMILQVVILLGEVVGGLLTHSLALLSDAGHVFTDVLALVVSLVAVKLAARPAAGRHTFGFRRAEILAALFNGLSLVVVSVVIFIEAYERWSNPRPVDTTLMLIIATAGFFGNLGGVLWLVRAQRTANIRSALLHLASDAVSSVAVVIGGIAMALGGPNLIDVVVSLFVGLLIVVSALRLVLDVLDVLLETAPTGMQPDTVIAALAGVSGVLEVHEFHLWRITHELPALSAHVLVDPACDRDQVLADMQALLANRFDIRHTTLQLEIDRLVRLGTRG